MTNFNILIYYLFITITKIAIIAIEDKQDDKLEYTNVVDATSEIFCVSSSSAKISSHPSVSGFSLQYSRRRSRLCSVDSRLSAMIYHIHSKKITILSDE